MRAYLINVAGFRYPEDYYFLGLEPLVFTGPDVPVSDLAELVRRTVAEVEAAGSPFAASERHLEIRRTEEALAAALAGLGFRPVKPVLVDVGRSRVDARDGQTGEEVSLRY